MNNVQKETIAKLVYIFCQKSNISDKNRINNIIDRLCNMNVNDAIDNILVSLNNLLQKGIVTQQEIFENLGMVVTLCPNQYPSISDLINRLSWLKNMNMEHPEMPLTENHILVMEIFDKFNKLLGGRFDCYYTGGLMGYLATNHKLERYHSDIDLFINEQQLPALKELIEMHPDFEFISNMDSKGVNGHEYQIVYKNTPISIGLFLFERKPDHSITTKEYYFEKQSDEKVLFVDEHHLSKAYTDLIFSETVRYKNGFHYKMVSLEAIYNLKKNSRPKDQYDANIIKNSVDMLIDYKIDIEKRNNYDIRHNLAPQCVINEIEPLIQKINSSTQKK